MKMDRNPKCYQVYAHAKQVLLITGLWPTARPTLTYKLKSTLSFFSSFIFLISLIMEIMVIFKDIKKFNEILSTTMPIVAYLCKLISYTINRQIFLSMIEDLDTNIFNRHPTHLYRSLAEAVTTMRRMAKLFMAILVAALFFYTLLPFIDKKPLPVPFTFFDLGKYRLAMLVFQTLNLIIAAWNTVGIDIACASFLVITSAQIKILRELLENVVCEAEKKVGREIVTKGNVAVNFDVDEEVNLLLKHCIIHYTAIIKLVDKIEQIYSVPLLVQYVTSMVLICTRIMQLSVMESIASSQFLVTMFLLIGCLNQLSLYHWFGNEVLTQSSQIGEACYASMWYLSSMKTRRTIFIMMERAKTPLYITIYKFTPVSLVSFVTIIRWSYSIFALMQNMYKEN